ncbi:MAG TPA: DUF3880 domain-containing protein [Lachnospiraceae bacterium]|nr:DUF3880 domain-containing protein [Lachnospiraceae bacterium]
MCGKSRILYLYSDRITLNDIPWGLVEIGREVEIYNQVVSLQYYVKEEYQVLYEYLRVHDFDLAIMHNFSAMVSDVCEALHMKYLSWIFDSPLVDLYTKSFYNKCNYIFVFDKKQYERLLLRGRSHLYHMPLAVNVDRMSAIQISEEDEKKYSCDISFVGNLYTQNAFNAFSSKIPVKIRAKMVEYMKMHVLKWEKDQTIFGMLDQQDVKELTEICSLGDWVDMNPGYYLEVQFLSRKMAEIERVCILNALALNQKVSLFTSDHTEMLENVTVCSEISYENDAPKVFQLSKINLNMTLRSIETGVPQRVFDIMGAGGFVISNYQEELETLFAPDVEIVLYHNVAELVEKVNYYLHHEKERIRIAMNGYLKVKKQYTYDKRLECMLEMVEKQESTEKK